MTLGKKRRVIEGTFRPVQSTKGYVFTSLPSMFVPPLHGFRPVSNPGKGDPRQETSGTPTGSGSSGTECRMKYRSLGCSPYGESRQGSPSRSFPKTLRPPTSVSIEILDPLLFGTGLCSPTYSTGDSCRCRHLLLGPQSGVNLEARRNTDLLVCSRGSVVVSLYGSLQEGFDLASGKVKNNGQFKINKK